MDASGEVKKWKSSEGALVVRVYFENVFNSLMDDCLGEAVIPLSALISNEREGGEQIEVSSFFEIVDLSESGERGGAGGEVKDLFGGGMHAKRKR